MNHSLLVKIHGFRIQEFGALCQNCQLTKNFSTTNWLCSRCTVTTRGYFSNQRFSTQLKSNLQMPEQAYQNCK